MKKKNKDYEVYLKVMVETSLEVSAESYEAALEKARNFGVKDVVEFDSPYNDGSISVIGIYNPLEESK